MTIKDLREILDSIQKDGYVSDDSVVCVSMNDGNGWISEPIEGMTVPSVIVKEYGKINKQHEIFKPQLIFAKKENK